MTSNQLQNIINDHRKHKDDHKKEKLELHKKIDKSKYKRKLLDDNETFGQKIADKVAKSGGSWGFIIIFVLFLTLWMFVNVEHLFGMKFDPYPFILLNLFLSCIAAIQAPVIMMSQNRDTARSDIKADNDAKVNRQSSAKQDMIMIKQDHAYESQEDIFNLIEGMAEEIIKLQKNVDDLKKPD